jgi:ADP-ribose pyrophosphatase
VSELGAKRWGVVGESVALETPWFWISRVHALAPGGAEIDYYVHHTNDSVLCVCVTHDNLVLIEEQYRLPIDQLSVDYPAGRVEDDDLGSDDAVRREIEEETGYIPASVKKLATIYKDPGFSGSKLHVYLAQGLLPGAKNLDDGEDIDAKLVNPLDILEMIRRGSISCAICLSATLLAFRELRWLEFTAQPAMPNTPQTPHS